MPHSQEFYKTIGNVRLILDMFQPEKRDASHGLPCIVFFHGGGWHSGSPSQFHPHCSEARAHAGFERPQVIEAALLETLRTAEVK